MVMKPYLRQVFEYFISKPNLAEIRTGMVGSNDGWAENIMLVAARAKDNEMLTAALRSALESGADRRLEYVNQQATYTKNKSYCAMISGMEDFRKLLASGGEFVYISGDAEIVTVPARGRLKAEEVPVQKPYTPKITLNLVGGAQAQDFEPAVSGGLKHVLNQDAGELMRAYLLYYRRERGKLYALARDIGLWFKEPARHSFWERGYWALRRKPR